MIHWQRSFFCRGIWTYTLVKAQKRSWPNNVGSSKFAKRCDKRLIKCLYLSISKCEEFARKLDLSGRLCYNHQKADRSILAYDWLRHFSRSIMVSDWSKQLFLASDWLSAATQRPGPPRHQQQLFSHFSENRLREDLIIQLLREALPTGAELFQIKHATMQPTIFVQFFF